MKRAVLSLVVASCAALTLTACSTVSEAADRAQEVVEQGSAVVSAATEIGAACATAATAWAPGVSPRDARKAIDEALTKVDETVAAAPDIPGVGAVQEALDTAQETLAKDPTTTSLGVSRETLQAACAMFVLGG